VGRLGRAAPRGAFFPRRREDYGTVIGWAAAHPDIDARQVFAWGTSFAGMYIVELAVSDSRLAGAIGQAPLVDGFAAARLASPVRDYPHWDSTICIGHGASR
jgi:dienelactone hydrolase